MSTPTPKSFRLSWDSTTVADGPLEITAEAVDEHGVVVGTETRSITVGNASPRTTIAVSQLIRWHVEAPQAATITAQWNIRVPVGQSRSGVWEAESLIVREPVGADRGAVWNIRDSHRSSKTSMWDVYSIGGRLPVAVETEALWDIAELTIIPAGHSTSAVWNTLAFVAVPAQRRTWWAVLGAGGIPASRGGSATLVVGGYPVPWTERSSIGVDTALGERSTMRGTIIDRPGEQEYAKGEQVRVYHADGTLVFGGITESATMRRISPVDVALTHNLQVKDWHYLADKHRAARGFLNRSAGDIVEELVETYLADEGIITVGPGEESTVFPGVQLSEFIVNYGRVSEAIDELAGLSDYWWRIDENRVLWFQPRGTRVAPWRLGRSDIHFAGSNPTQVAHGNAEYRNRQTILGGIEQTDRQTEVREGNGIRTTYAMRYALYSAPTVESSTNNGQTWTGESVAEEGSEAAPDARWTWERGSRDVVTRFSPPATGVLMRFRYTGQYPIVVVEDDEDAITDRQVVEGGTGVVEDMEVAAYGPSRGFAMAVAEARLHRYAVLGKTLQTQTLRTGLAVGQILTVDLPERGLDGTEMLITRLGYQFDGKQAWYSVTAVEGPDVSPWKALGSMVRTPQPVGERVTVGESAATLVVWKEFRRVWEPEDDLPAWNEIYPAPDLYPSPTLYPSAGSTQWITYLAWEVDGVEFGRRPVTRVTVATETRRETTVFLGHDVANVSITHLVWYGGSSGNVLIERVAWQYDKNELEALQIDRIDIREAEGV